MPEECAVVRLRRGGEAEAAAAAAGGGAGGNATAPAAAGLATAVLRPAPFAPASAIVSLVGPGPLARLWAQLWGRASAFSSVLLSSVFSLVPLSEPPSDSRSAERWAPALG